MRQLYCMPSIANPCALLALYVCLGTTLTSQTPLPFIQGVHASKSYQNRQHQSLYTRPLQQQCWSIRSICQRCSCCTNMAPAHQFRSSIMLQGNVSRLRGGDEAGEKHQLEPRRNNSDSLQPKPEESREHKRLMILIKVLFLAYYASLGSLMPYLPVYYHSLGHGGLIIGLIGAVKPFTTFIVAPFWGILSDRSNDKFRILKLTFMVSLIGQLLVSYSHEVRFLVIMTLLTAVMNAPVKSLIDSMVMDHLSDEDRSQYGKLRLWGQLGFGLGSSGVGMLLSRSQSRRQEQPSMSPIIDGATLLQVILRGIYNTSIKFWYNLTGYKLLFSTYAVLSLPTWLCLQAFQQMDERNRKAKMIAAISTKNTTTKTGGAHIMEGLNLLIHNADALLFFFLIFSVGVSSGIIENFAYVRMREVGGHGKEMGLSRLVSSAAGAPMFWFSGPLTERLGVDRVLVLSLLSYVFRFLIYAFMRNPYHGLPAEALRGLTFAAFWSTGTIYAHRISPPGMNATMLMFLNAMYGGLGQSVGALVGGKLQSNIGTVQTFLCAAGADFCLVVLVISYLSVRKNSNFRDPQPILPDADTNKTQ